MKKQLNLHLISDSTGETITLLAKAVISQFPDAKINEHRHFLIKNEAQMQKTIDKVLEDKGVILYTIVNKQIADMLNPVCERDDVLCIPAVTPLVEQFSNFFNIESVNRRGKQHEINEEYYSRIESINYTLMHDDGNLSDDLYDADIILLGVSRSSKSPTSIYLAYKGYKVANIPFVKAELMPDYLQTLKKPLIVGLTINPERLKAIRDARMKTLEVNKETDYIDVVKIQEEIVEAKKYFSKLGIDVINVTEKSIEETAGYIIKLFEEKQLKEQAN